MKRPAVELQNQEALYAYYAARMPHPPTGRFVHGVLGTVFHPQVSYDTGAEKAIDTHFAENGRVLLASNHVSAADPLVLAALAQREPVLRPLVGNVVIPAHAGLFKYRMLRPLLDNFVAIPTFRGKDVAGLPLSEDRIRALRMDAAKSMVDTCIQKANADVNIAIFPQGTRSSGNVRAGIGYMACGLREPDRFRLLPVGIDYSRTSTRLSPNVHVGEPLPLPNTPSLVAKLTEQQMIRCVAAARASY
jgi:1-acyl-sn-glycerol-3-phosphate acyltransferase